MRFLPLLALFVACTEPTVIPVDDLPPTPRTKPLINIAGQFEVDDADLLPNQEENWCEVLTVASFPDYEGCFADVISCHQRIDFASNNPVTRIFELQAKSCFGDFEERHTPSKPFGHWTWLEPSERGGDIFLVNAMRWDVVRGEELGTLEVVMGQDEFRLWRVDVEDEISGG